VRGVDPNAGANVSSATAANTGAFLHCRNASSIMILITFACALVPATKTVA
jgi:hypothetical protein